MNEPLDARAPRRTPWAWAVATFGGIGLVGKGGGTVASIATIMLFWAAAHFISLTYLQATIAALTFATASTLVGIPAGSTVARECGRKDPSQVVIDEVAGQSIALIGMPMPFDWKYVLAGLILFRLFDIFKPPPVRQLESLPGGAGIMMDDVAAGFMALLMLNALRLLGAF